MDDTTHKGKLIPEGAVRSHPVAWVVVIFCVFFTSVSVFRDVLGWEASKRSAYFGSCAMSISMFVYARYLRGRP